MSVLRMDRVYCLDVGPRQALSLSSEALVTLQVRAACGADVFTLQLMTGEPIGTLRQVLHPVLHGTYSVDFK